MAIKTFTTGEVLTASDTNTYLANSGLVYVKQQTVGSGVTSVTVTDAFSATYDNYKIIYSNGATNVSGVLDFALAGSTNGHYSVLNYSSYGAALNSFVKSNNAASWTHVGGVVSLTPFLSLEIQNPFLAKTTGFTSSFIDSVNT